MPSEQLTDPTSPVSLRRRPALDLAEIAAANAALEGRSPAEIVGWAVERFGARLALTASFADTTLVDIATQVAPDVEVLFLDTGFHFAETLDTLRRAMIRYELNLTVLRPSADAADVWAHGTTRCCDERKVAPLDRYLVAHHDAWLSGVRRADSPERADAAIVAIDRRGLVKINPMAAMSDADYAAYGERRQVIVNALASQGYASIGCWPCTEPSANGREGRWSDSTKTECGLHL